MLLLPSFSLAYLAYARGLDGLWGHASWPEGKLTVGCWGVRRRRDCPSTRRIRIPAGSRSRSVGERQHEPHRRACERVDRSRLIDLPELLVEQQYGAERHDGRGKAEEGPAVIVVAEQRRAVARISRHDVQQNLPRSEGRAGEGGEQRHGIM